MNSRRPEEIERAKHIILRAMNEDQQKIRLIAGKDFTRLRGTCKDGNWSYLCDSLKVDMTYWELKCIAQRQNNMWLKPFTRMVRDENFAEFLHKALKWDEENLNSIGIGESKAGSENGKTRQYIANLMGEKGFCRLVDGITAGVSLIELTKMVIWGDPTWEVKVLEIVHNREFAIILVEELRFQYLKRKLELEEVENMSFLQAQAYIATILRLQPYQEEYHPEDVVDSMLVDMSVRALKLLVLNSFGSSNYDVYMDEAIQHIADMVFDYSAARTIYWAIFDNLMDSGELFRKKLDDSPTKPPESTPLPIPARSVLRDKPAQAINHQRTSTSENQKEDPCPEAHMGWLM